MNKFEQSVHALRAPLPSEPSLRDFVRFATLAPNSHNTQPWKFRLGTNQVDILPDFGRRTPAVDPDDHHLYVTLGCAAENLVIAAAASGRSADVSIMDEGEPGTSIRITLAEGDVRDQDLCGAILERQSTRSVYDGKPLSTSELAMLRDAAEAASVEAIFVTDRAKMDEASTLIQQGNSAQVDDPAFVGELKSWIRFNAEAALTTSDGLFAKCSGNPTGPTWIGKFMFDRAFTKKSENMKYAKQISSSAGLVVFVAKTDDPKGWIEAGRAFERFALRASLMGIRHAHLNMPVEVASLRPAFADWLGVPGRRPNLVIRFGRAPLMSMSLRRSVDDVLEYT